MVTDVILDTTKITLYGETETPDFEKPFGTITIGTDAEASGPNSGAVMDSSPKFSF